MTRTTTDSQQTERGRSSRRRGRRLHLVLLTFVMALVPAVFVATPAQAVTTWGGCDSGGDRCWRSWTVGNGLSTIDHAEIYVQDMQFHVRACDYDKTKHTLGVEFDPSDGKWIVLGKWDKRTNDGKCQHWATGYANIRKFRFASYDGRSGTWVRTGVTDWQTWTMPPWRP